MIRKLALAGASALALLGATPAFAAGFGIQGSPVVITDVTGMTQCLHAILTGKVSGTGADCVTQAGNNVFTGNNTFQTGTLLFKQDPTISSGGSTTDGATFFGTNLGSRFFGYLASADSGRGGYQVGSTFGNSDTLYVGPVRFENPGATAGVYMHAGSSGVWDMTLPTSAGSSGQLLKTDGAGVTSWVSAAVGANPTATAGTSPVNGSAATFMRSDGAPALPGAGTGQQGIVTLATAGIACTGTSTTTALTPASMAATTGYFCMPGGIYFEYGSATSSGTSTGNVTITFPHALPSAVLSVSGTVGGATGLFTINSCNTTSCTGSIQNSSTLAFLSGSVVFWHVIGN